MPDSNHEIILATTYTGVLNSLSPRNKGEASSARPCHQLDGNTRFQPWRSHEPFSALLEKSSEEAVTKHAARQIFAVKPWLQLRLVPEMASMSRVRIVGKLIRLV
jgi:hypothetical protein